MGQRRAKLSDQVRRAVEAAPISRNAICQAAGIDRGFFSRFMNGTASLGMPTLDALGEVLGLDVVVTKASGRGPSQKGNRK